MVRVARPSSAHADRSRTLGIRVLNLLILIPLLTASINGLDSSLVNGALVLSLSPCARSPLTCLAIGLQILPSWQGFFKHPNGKTLGTPPSPRTPHPP